MWECDNVGAVQDLEFGALMNSLMVENLCKPNGFLLLN